MPPPKPFAGCAGGVFRPSTATDFRLRHKIALNAVSGHAGRNARGAEQFIGVWGKPRRNALATALRRSGRQTQGRPNTILLIPSAFHRIGQTETVRVLHIVLKDSVDGRMVRSLVEKQNTIERVMK